MDCKYFFRPNKWKLLFTLVLTVIFEYGFYYLGATSVVCEACHWEGYCPPCIAIDIGISMALKFLVPTLIIVYLVICTFMHFIKNKKIFY